MSIETKQLRVKWKIEIGKCKEEMTKLATVYQRRRADDGQFPLVGTRRNRMRSRTTLLLEWIAICLLGGSAQTSATPGSFEGMSQIRVTSRALIEAQLRYDPPAVAQLLTKDFVYVGNDGSVASKKEFLPSAKDRKLRPLQALEWELRQVQFYGNTAVAVYSIHEKNIENGKPHEFRGRSLATWVKVNGRWLCAAIHD